MFDISHQSMNVRNSMVHYVWSGVGIYYFLSHLHIIQIEYLRNQIDYDKTVMYKQ